MSVSFLQSEEWERIQQALGRRTFRAAGALLVRHDLPFKLHYLYAPRPYTRSKKQEVRSKERLREEFFYAVREIALREKSIFFKIDPPLNSSMSHACPVANWYGVACRMAHSIQSQKTTTVDLMKGEDEMLRAMHPKTRYNIRVAERAGVMVEGVDSERADARETFWHLLQETAFRDGFHPHSRRHYDTLMSVRTGQFSNELFFAQIEGGVSAAALVNFYAPSGTATYLHGASGRVRKEAMAPTLLHWRIMQEARRRGFRSYDFGGIDDVRRPGLTRFKRGFGGADVTYPSAVDWIFRPLLYRFYRIARRLLHHDN